MPETSLILNTRQKSRFGRLVDWLRAVKSDDVVKERRGRLFSLIALAIFSLFFGYTLFTVFLLINLIITNSPLLQSVGFYIEFYAILGFFSGGYLTSYYINRKGYTATAACLGVGLFTLQMFVFIFLNVVGNPKGLDFIFIPFDAFVLGLACLITGMVLRPRAAFVIPAILMFYLIILYFLVPQNGLSDPDKAEAIEFILISVIYNWIMGLLGWMFGTYVEKAVREQDARAREATELRAAMERKIVLAQNAELEERVKERTTQLAKRVDQLDLINSVGRDATSTLDLNELLPKVANLIHDTFGYYAVLILLVEKEKNVISLGAAATTEKVNLLEQGMAWGMDVGLIGHVAATGKSILVRDVSSEPLYHYEARLPGTRSEMVLPLPFAGGVMGVLDLESDELNAFVEEDVQVLQTLADQIAIAIHNADLYEMQAHLSQIAQIARTEAEAAKQIAEVARAEAETANEFKSQFLANMSHELRTPLTAIINFASLSILNEELYGKLSERHRHFIQRIGYNGDHLLGLINDVLDLAKIEAGRMELIYEKVELHNLFEGVLATTTGLTRDKGLTITLDAPKQLPKVTIDKTRIRQILLNLLSNAAKFTEKGSITVHVRLEPENFIYVGVEDTGIGIAPENQMMVFEEFRQVHNAHAPHKGGTGLGLPISKRLVEMHGGRMWLENSSKFGSTFAFNFPINPPNDKSMPEMPLIEKDSSSSMPHVVIVDDDARDQKILAGYLDKVGYRVTAITDSLHAVPLIKKMSPDLIVLDVLMPSVGGWEIMQALRNDPQTHDIPVILCSVVHQQDLGVTMGANGFLRKPVKEEDLLQLVRQWASPAATVLVVEEDSVEREIAHNILETHGYRVITAVDGNEGLAKTAMEGTHPDLVLLDLEMHDMDGFSVLARLREDQMTQDLPVIMATPEELSPEKNSSLNDRVALIQQKSFSPAAFLMYVNHLTTLKYPHANFSGKVVAIIDDTPENLFVATEILKTNLGVINCHNFSSGAQLFALQQTDKNIKFDLILLDIGLPDEDGYDILQKIRKISSWQDSKVIAFTADVMPQHLQKAREAGFDGFIGKPITPERFLKQIPRIFAGEDVWEPR